MSERIETSEDVWAPRHLRHQKGLLWLYDEADGKLKVVDRSGTVRCVDTGPVVGIEVTDRVVVATRTALFEATSDLRLEKLGDADVDAIASFGNDVYVIVTREGSTRVSIFGTVGTVAVLPEVVVSLERGDDGWIGISDGRLVAYASDFSQRRVLRENVHAAHLAGRLVFVVTGHYGALGVVGLDRNDQDGQDDEYDQNDQNDELCSGVSDFSLSTYANEVVCSGTDYSVNVLFAVRAALRESLVVSISPFSVELSRDYVQDDFEFDGPGEVYNYERTFVFGLVPDSEYVVSTSDARDAFRTPDEQSSLETFRHVDRCFGHLEPDCYRFDLVPEVLGVLSHTCREVERNRVRLTLRDRGRSRSVLLAIARDGATVDLDEPDGVLIVGVMDVVVSVVSEPSLVISTSSPDVVRVGNAFYYPGDLIESSVIFHPDFPHVVLLKSRAHVRPETGPRPGDGMGPVHCETFRCDKLSGVTDADGVYRKTLGNAARTTVVSGGVVWSTGDVDGSFKDRVIVRPDRIVFDSGSTMTLDDRGLSLDSGCLVIGNHRVRCEGEKLFVESYDDASGTYGNRIEID